MCTNHDDQTAAIDCKQLTKVYKSLWTTQSQHVCALRDVSLSIEAGQIVGLIGPNGAGKTTLMNLIAGLLRPTSGDITVGGFTAGSMKAKRLLGYMPESPAFLEGYTVEAMFNYYSSLCHIGKDGRAKQSQELLDRLGLHSMRSRQCGSLSHGMRQRLGLAIAMVMQPKVLILDEPSNALDPIGIVQLRELVFALSSEGTAILISSHRLYELEKITSTFIGIWNGQIVDIGKNISPENGQLVRIEIKNEFERAKQLLSTWDVVRASGTEVILKISSQQDIASIVSHLTKKGVYIKSLCCDDESIEDVFLRISQNENREKEQFSDR